MVNPGTPDTLPPSRGHVRTLLRQYVWAQRSPVTVMAALLATSIALAVLAPDIVAYFITRVQAGAAEPVLFVVVIVYIVVAVAQQAATAAATYWSQRVAWTATNRLRGDLTAHVLDLDLSYHETQSPGELVNRIDSDVEQITGFFSDFVVQLMGNVLLLVGIILAVLFTVDWRVGLAFAVVSGAGLYVVDRVRRFGTKEWSQDREESGTFYGFLTEVLRATEDLRALNAGRHAMASFHARLRRWLPVAVRARAWASSVWMATILAITIVTAIAYGAGGLLYRDGELTLSKVYLLISYALLLIMPMEAIRTQLQYLQQAAAAVRRVGELLMTEPSMSEGTRRLPSGPLAVAFEHVHFGYRGTADESGANVLHDFSFTLEPGRYLGLVGRTGAGKTTIAQLLYRFYDPQSGTVRIGGCDLRDVTWDAIRTQVGYVGQDIQLVHGTLRDNLTFFDADTADAELLDVLTSLGLRAWLHRFPDGLDSMVSHTSLSAGEAQLIGLARVFMKRPGLLILDEPTSKVDPDTERFLQRAIDTLLARATGIVIAHRLATLAKADEILIIDDGRVVEHDFSERLLADRESAFAALLRTGELAS